MNNSPPIRGEQQGRMELVGGHGRVDELFARARRRLAGRPREALGELVLPRRVLGVGRAPRIVPVGEAWHIGVLLLTDDEVLATGEILRAREEVRRGYPAQSQRERAELAAAAFRGGFAEGQVVHLGWTRLEPDAVARGEASGPLSLVDGVAHVRWSPTAAPRPLVDYLDDQLSL
ncbi:glutaminase [Microbacterium sp.]|uniref:glutaminase n=1 Tax=Microbacterium sp. TaxID=51671 RepID=UPI0039E26A50